MMVFLFASPLLNSIIIGLFAVTFELEVTLFYFVMAIGVSIVAGFVLEKLGVEQYVKKEAYAESQAACCGTECGGAVKPKSSFLQSKWLKIWCSTWKDFVKVLPYLIGGIALGSMIYGFMPTEFVAQVASEDNPLVIPIAAVIGIPLYIRAEAVIPLSAALAAKGMGLGQ